MYWYISILSAVLATGYSLTLQSTHTNVIPKLTDDVALHCFSKGSNNVEPAIEQLTRIRLVKMDNTNAWDTYAEVILPNTSTVVLTDPTVPGVVSSGHLGKLDDTFLSVTWSTSSDDTVGSFKCEVDGFVVDRGNDFHVITNVINITNNPVSTTDLLDIAIQMRKKSDDMAKELNAVKTKSMAQHQELKAEISNELKGFQEKTEIQHRQLNSSLMSQVKSNIEDSYLELRHWPSGNYSLLAPVAGCPDTPHSKFLSGHVTVETETSVKPNHNFFSANHLSEDIYERCGSRNVLRFPWCTRNVNGARKLWPRGTYCVQYNDPSCPPGFNFGYTTIRPEGSTDFKVVYSNVNNPMWINPSGRYFNSHFCCRDDGDASIPIFLPNSRPFYLYRPEELLHPVSFLSKVENRSSGGLKHLVLECMLSDILDTEKVKTLYNVGIGSNTLDIWNPEKMIYEKISPNHYFVRFK